MNELFAYLFFFLIGFLIGGGTFMSYGLYQVEKSKKAKKKLLEDLQAKTQEMEQKTSAIKERLVRASRIAQTQMELRAQAEMPSKNGLHSQYKNGLASEINELEREKLAILRTILSDGFNPMITVILEGGGKEEISLSEYVTRQTAATGDKKPDAAQPPPLPSVPNEPRKVGKFFIYKGGKDDGTTH
jgi:hypothetical protein